MSKEIRAVKDYLFGKYGLRCEVCGQEFGRAELTAHHIIMVCKGGEASVENILIACKDCHFKKINKMEYDSKEYWLLMKKSLAHRETNEEL